MGLHHPQQMKWFEQYTLTKGKSDDRLQWFDLKSRGSTTTKNIPASTIFNFRAAISPTVSVQLGCTLSGIMSTASCLGMTVDLIGPLGQVKSILHSRRAWGSDTSCHFRHSAHATFRLQSKPLRGQTS